jgi:hypothetical protein
MRPDKTLSRRLRFALVALFPLEMLMGCQRAPSFSIAGSYFPDWILCSFVGIMVAALAHGLFLRLKMEREIQPAVLIYPCIALSCAVTLWLLFFR